MQRNWTATLRGLRRYWRGRTSKWSVEDIGGYFVVKTGNDRPLVFIYYWDGVARRSLAKLLTRDAARLIAAGIAKLPGLVQWPSKGTL